MPVDGLATARPQASQAPAPLGLWRELSVGEFVCDVESQNPGEQAEIRPKHTQGPAAFN